MKKQPSFWIKPFEEVFEHEDDIAFLVTWVTCNSRTSERMERLDIKTNDRVWLNARAEVKITEIIKNIVIKSEYKILAYNICGDHVHMVIVCTEKELPKIVQKLKGKSARFYNQWVSNSFRSSPDKGFKPLVSIRGATQSHLWAQKFNRRILETEEQLFNAIEYV